MSRTFRGSIRQMRRSEITAFTSVHGLNGDAENVSRLTLSSNVTRTVEIALELAPQPHDLRVNGAAAGVVAVQARHIEQLRAGKNALGRCEERDEQTEFNTSQADHVSGGRGKPPCIQVELPAVKSVRACSGRSALLHLG